MRGIANLGPEASLSFPRRVGSCPKGLDLQERVSFCNRAAAVRPQTGVGEGEEGAVVERALGWESGQGSLCDPEHVTPLLSGLWFPHL